MRIEISNKLNTQNLVAGLLALKQMPPDDLALDSLENIWSWAIDNWNSKTLAMTRSLKKPNL